MHTLVNLFATVADILRLDVAFDLSGATFDVDVDSIHDDLMLNQS